MVGGPCQERNGLKVLAAIHPACGTFFRVSDSLAQGASIVRGAGVKRVQVDWDSQIGCSDGPSQSDRVRQCEHCDHISPGQREGPIGTPARNADGPSLFSWGSRRPFVTTDASNTSDRCTARTRFDRVPVTLDVADARTWSRCAASSSSSPSHLLSAAQEEGWRTFPIVEVDR